MPSTELTDRARRIVTDPASVSCEPALMADAFLTLVEARGGVTRFCNLGAPAHRIGPARHHIEAPMAENVIALSDMQQVDAIRRRIPDHIRRILSGSFGGDAA